MGPTSVLINIWALPGGPSADPERTVREAGVTKKKKEEQNYCSTYSYMTKKIEETRTALAWSHTLVFCMHRATWINLVC